MGNYQSNTEIDNLKILYNMNQNELNKLKRVIKKEKIRNTKLVSALKQKQTLLVNKIPQNKHITVSNFLEDIDTYETELYGNQLVPLSKDELYQNYESLETKYEEQFQQQQQEQRRQFIEQQKIRRQKYEKELEKFNKSNINAYKLFKLNENFTMKELKLSYKKLALIYHPDRPTGNNQKFQLITKAYLSLLEELNLKKPEKSYNELKKNSQTFREEQNNNPKKNIYMTDRFDVNLFNKIYTDNKLQKPEDDGYSEWMKQNEYDTTDIKKSEVFSDNFNINVFNSSFAESNKNNTEIIEYKTPEALYSGGNSNQELGIDKIENYSGNGFTDYKEAHSSKIINSNNIRANHNTFKTVDELKKHRENLVPLSDAELRKLENETKIKEEIEKRKQENIGKNDRREFDNYNKINRRMIESNFFQ